MEFIAASLMRALVLHQQPGTVVLKGKRFDSKVAYKQYPIHPTDRQHLRIVIRDLSTCQAKLYGLNSLPFGLMVVLQFASGPVRPSFTS